MIFNPYNLTNNTAETVTTASNELLWAHPLLQNNLVIVATILGFLLVDILAFCPRGVIEHQVKWITDTRNSRTFESQVMTYRWIRPLLMVQLFLFFGLSLYCIYDDSPALHLSQLRHTTWQLLLVCLSALLAWYLFQRFCYNWFCYLFNLREKQTIMNRTYQAGWMIIAVPSMFVFILLMSSSISGTTALFLLATLFILSQLSFIYSGIKIFFDSFGSLLLIFVYLCTLEIAPILVILAKLTTLQQ